MRVIDETGNHHNRLEVLRRANPSAPSYATGAYWLCRCECGTELIVYGAHLRTGKVKSCGCLRSETVRKNRKSNKGKKYNIYDKKKERAL